MSLFKKHPIIANIILVIGLGVIMLVASLIFMDKFTHHGEYVVVPELSGKSVVESAKVCDGVGIECEVVDSIYVDSSDAGAVVDVHPKPGLKVKPGRTIYLTINAFGSRKVIMPDLIDFSERQARATLAAMGVSNVSVKYEPGNYDNLVVGVVDAYGDELPAGMRISVNHSIVLVVTTFDESVQIDTLLINPDESALDSLNNSTEEISEDESWF